MTEKTIALLVAAGTSTRMGSDMPKPYLQLQETSILRHTVKTFLDHPLIDGVRVVIRREHHPYYLKATEGLTFFPSVMGGATRQGSVRKGLESLAHRNPQKILIHDIARPLASPGLISRVINALDSTAAAIPALPIVDTVKRANGNTVEETISRENLYAIQTPQGFHFDELLAVHHRYANESYTDDAALFEKAGIGVTLVEGDPDNVKITTRTDLERMQAMLAQHTETRTGLGYDVHQLKPHDAETSVSQQTIKLCGVRIPFTHYLQGHSDADVGMHALVDAILGAISAGDIGSHFPPDDRKWQGADSARFLLHAYELVKSRGGEIIHLDVTVICERPKIAPYREQMIEHIAQLLKLDSNRISIKATTSEKLGFTGRGEGIAAQAVATIRLPR